MSNYEHHKHRDDVASAFIWAAGSELQSIHECTTSLMLALLLFLYPPATHRSSLWASADAGESSEINALKQG